MSDPKLKPCPFCGGSLDDIIKEERRKAKIETYEFLIFAGVIACVAGLVVLGLVNWLFTLFK